MAAAATPPAGDSREPGEYRQIMDLLSAAESFETASRLDPESFITHPAALDSASSLWPIYRFLLAEVYRLRGEEQAAWGCYTDLAESVLARPGRHGSAPAIGLACLLRTAELLRAAPQPDPEKVKYLIQLSETLVRHPQAPSWFELPVLGGLPHLAERLLKDLALLAWRVGDIDAAGFIFAKYLETASTADMDREELEMADHLVSQGICTEGELTLARGKRLYSLRDFEHARGFLSDARACGIPGIEAQAGYYLSRTRSAQGAPRGEIINLLTSALEAASDPHLIQEILLYRAEVFNRDGAARDINRALEDLSQIVKRFPAGQLADDALYEMARHHETERDTEKALASYARLRDHGGPNDWVASSHFRAAMILYARDNPGDTEEAAGLLRDLIAARPTGDLTLAAMFWLGRIAAETGDSLGAHSQFLSVTQASPYDYYAIRALMHLNNGTDAARSAMPDSNTLDHLRDAYLTGIKQGSPLDDVSSRQSPVEALESGLYSKVLSTSDRLTTAFPSKYPNQITLEDLDRTGTFAAASILLSLRQDAARMATRADSGPGAVSLAYSAGYTAGDWPLAMLLVFGLDPSLSARSKAQQDARYPTVAYPPAYLDLIDEAARRYDVPAELLYAVIRRESLFHRVAVSRVGALGLFQFMPSTFQTLDRRWDLLEDSDAESPPAFLFSPRLAIDLGARWFADELLERHQGNLLLAVMEHNAGYPAVKSWIASWKDTRRIADIEYMIESADFAETRGFARSVLADMAIARAIGLFRRARQDTSYHQ